MQSPAPDEILEGESGLRAVTAKDVESLLGEILTGDHAAGWTSEIELDLGTKFWRPSAVSGDRARLLYISLQEEFPRHVLARLRLAAANSIGVVIALSLTSLFQPEIIKVLVELDCDVMVIDDYRKDRRFECRHFLTAIADVEVPLSPESRKMIGQATWARIGDGTSQERGRRLEALLAFLFSQITDLKVVERNYRNETEEIDLVLQVDNFSTRIWQNPGVPFVLVEAKNRADKVSQQMMSVLIAKLQTKRGTTRIGILVSPAGFTEDAKMQELRFSTDTICVVMIDRAGIESLVNAEDLDGELEALVRHALLR